MYTHHINWKEKIKRSYSFWNPKASISFQPRKKNLLLHDYRKIKKEKTKWKYNFECKKRWEFLSSFWLPPSFSISLSFYLMENPNPHIPTSLFLFSKKLEVLFKVDNLYLNSTTTLSYKEGNIVLYKISSFNFRLSEVNLPK